MKTNETIAPKNEVAVKCSCCRRKATTMVKDNGFKVYPVCDTCLLSLHRPTILRLLMS